MSIGEGMFHLTILAILGAPTLVSPNSQVERTEAVVQVSADAVKSLEPIGRVLSVSTVTEDKFPKPHVKILGAENPIEIGESIDLAVEDVLPQGVIQAQYSWGVLQNGREKRVKVWPDNKSIYFGAGKKPTKYNVALSVSYLYNLNGEVTSRLSDIVFAEVVVVDSDNPIPPPNPTPNPIPPNPTPIPPNPTPIPPPNPTPIPPNPTPPTPVVPEGKFGLTKQAFELFAPLKKEARTALIKAHSEYNTLSPAQLKEMIDIVRTKNIAKLTEASVQISEVQSTISRMDDKLFSLYESGQIKTVQDYKDCQTAIIDGLRLLP